MYHIILSIAYLSGKDSSLLADCVCSLTLSLSFLFFLNYAIGWLFWTSVSNMSVDEVKMAEKQENSDSNTDVSDAHTYRQTIGPPYG